MKEFDKKGSPSREGFSKFLPASMSDSSTRRRLTEYEIQVQDLQAYIRSLEAETVHLRKKLEDTPKDFMVLENKLREANRQLVQAFNQNEKLVNALYEAREQITALKEEVDKLCAPPNTYGIFNRANKDGTAEKFRNHDTTMVLRIPEGWAYAVALAFAWLLVIVTAYTVARSVMEIGTNRAIGPRPSGEH
jgi:hypothetical protein